MSEQVIAGAAGSLTGGGGFGSVMSVAGWTIWGLVLGGIIYAGWYFLKNKYEARIFEMTGSGVRQSTDKFREVRDKINKAIVTYKFAKHPDDFDGEIPRKSFILKKTMFGYKEIVYLYKDDAGKLHLMNADSFVGEVKFKPVDSANQKWANLKTQQLIEDFTNADWWDQYGQTIMIAGVIVITLVVMVVMVRELGAFTESTASALGNVADSLRAVAESSQSQFITPDQGGAE